MRTVALVLAKWRRRAAATREPAAAVEKTRRSWPRRSAAETRWSVASLAVVLAAKAAETRRSAAAAAVTRRSEAETRRSVAGLAAGLGGVARTAPFSEREAPEAVV